MDFAQFLYVSVLSFRYPSHSFSACALLAVHFLCVCCSVNTFAYCVVWATVVLIWWAMVEQKWKCNSKQHINNLQKRVSGTNQKWQLIPFSSWEFLPNQSGCYSINWKLTTTASVRFGFDRILCRYSCVISLLAYALMLAHESMGGASINWKQSTLIVWLLIAISDKISQVHLNQLIAENRVSKSNVILHDVSGWNDQKLCKN